MNVLHTYTIFEVMKLGGPVVAHCESSGMLITINDVCFSSWTETNGKFVGGTECLISNIEKVGDCTDFKLVVEVAHEWLLELLEREGEDEPSNS